VLGEEHVLALADEGGRERRVDGHRAVSLGGIESSGSELVEGGAGVEGLQSHPAGGVMPDKAVATVAATPSHCSSRPVSAAPTTPRIVARMRNVVRALPP